MDNSFCIKDFQISTNVLLFVFPLSLTPIGSGNDDVVVVGDEKSDTAAVLLLAAMISSLLGNCNIRCTIYFRCAHEDGLCRTVVGKKMRRNYVCEQKSIQNTQKYTQAPQGKKKSKRKDLRFGMLRHE